MSRWLGVLGVAVLPSQNDGRWKRPKPWRTQQAGCLLHVYLRCFLPRTGTRCAERVRCTRAIRRPRPSIGMAALVVVEHGERCLDRGRRVPYNAGVGALQHLIEALNEIKKHLLSLSLTFPERGQRSRTHRRHDGRPTNPHAPTEFRWSRPMTHSGARPI